MALIAQNSSSQHSYLCDLPLTGWEDTALTDKLANIIPNNRIVSQKSLHSIYRKKIKPDKRLMNIHNTQNIDPSHEFNYLNAQFSKTGQLTKESDSSFSKLKKRIKSIEKDNVRWECEQSQSKQHNYTFFKQKIQMAKPGFVRSASQNDRKRIFHTTSKIHIDRKQDNKDNKMRLSTSNITAVESMNAYKSLELRTQTADKRLNSRSYVKVPFLKYKLKKKKNEMKGTLQICINQLQNSKMKEVLKCLQKLH